MTIQEEIIEWASKKLQLWQQDALRRIIEFPSLSDKDVGELVLLCKNEFGIAADDSQAKLLALPIELETQNSNAEDNDSKIALTCIKDVVDINALAPNQTISFIQNGLTVIYGDNGAGKTSYCRIIKALSRARSQKVMGDILPNFTNNEEKSQSAQVDYIVGIEQKTLQWFPDKDSPSILSNISFFDSDCASVYVEKETDVAYRPCGLDILDKLVHFTDLVKGKLLQEASTLQQQIYIPVQEFHPSTKAYLLVSKLGSDEIKTEMIDQVCDLKPEDHRRYKFLNENLTKTDPVQINQKIRGLSSEVTKSKSLKDHLEIIRTTFSSEAISETLSLKNQLETVRQASQVAAKEALKDTLAGTGNEVWRELWDAARRYSSVAYESKQFPVVNTAKCLLCQQDLNKQASDRLSKFETFVKNDLSQREDILTKKFNGIVDSFVDFDINNQFYTSVIDGLTDEKLKHSVNDFLIHVGDLKSEVIKGLKTGSDIASRDLLPTPENKISKYIAELNTQIESLQDLLKKDRSKLEQEQSELEDRITLNKKKLILIGLHKKQSQVNKIQACANKINTAPISIKNGDLTEKVITEQLINAFRDELVKLNLHSIEIELKQIRNEKGSSYFRALIKHPKGRTINLGKIASDGEHRTIALAGFLSELSTADHKSSIVFDDPVSSLDHTRRTSIATRLIQESKSRQVIVFTHDLYFLSLLDQYSEAESVDTSFWWIRGELNGKGVVYYGKPWIAMPVSKRIGYLKNKVQQAKSKRKLSEDNYIIEAQNIYDLLRQSWERAIEEVLFNQVILRYREGIETKRLDKITDVTLADCEKVTSNMTKCSRFKHDQCLSANVTLPEPNEIEQDIAALENWISELRARRKD